MTPQQTQEVKNKICLHEKHITPETRWFNSYGTLMPGGLEKDLRFMGLIADKCVDCGEDIDNLGLLKVGV
jgi:hypothetical protein